MGWLAACLGMSHVSPQEVMAVADWVLPAQGWPLSLGSGLQTPQAVKMEVGLQAGLEKGRWVQDLRVWSCNTAAPWFLEAAGLEGVLWLFPICRDRILEWVKLIAQSAIYTHFLLRWKALRYCSHLDLGAQTPLGPELVPIQVVNQRQASSPPRSRLLPPHHDSLSLWRQEGSCPA